MQVHDRMTEQVYLEPLQSFTSPVTPSPVFTVPVLEQGRRALEDINEELGLAFDEQVGHHLVTWTQLIGSRDCRSIASHTTTSLTLALIGALRSVTAARHRAYGNCVGMTLLLRAGLL